MHLPCLRSQVLKSSRTSAGTPSCALLLSMPPLDLLLAPATARPSQKNHTLTGGPRPSLLTVHRLRRAKLRPTVAHATALESCPPLRRLRHVRLPTRRGTRLRIPARVLRPALGRLRSSRRSARRVRTDQRKRSRHQWAFRAPGHNRLRLWVAAQWRRQRTHHAGVRRPLLRWELLRPKRKIRSVSLCEDMAFAGGSERLRW